MFAQDYSDARARFQRAADKRNDSLPLSVRGPRGEPLSIEIAWLGPRAARRIVLVTSGLHGVEGFAGSAVQCALLAAPPESASDCALVLVHALNPWGFAHLRRVNEHNVDLNRNFVRAHGHAGSPPLYPALDPLLNPRSPPRADAFLLRAACYALRHGVQPCRQAIAGGQYEFERGLFYGGRALEEAPARFLAWAHDSLAHADRLLVLDLHTGLGRFGAQTLLAEPEVSAERVAQWARTLGASVVGGGGRSDPAGFAARGSLATGLRECLAEAQFDFFTVEHGTYPGLKVLHALREENRWHHYGDGGLAHPAKRRLVEVFAPASARWREGIVAAGDRLVRAAVAAIGSA